jgi:hypothetical protein
MRAAGSSIKSIAGSLDVSPSSVSRWVRDIELTPDQIEALRANNPIVNGQLKGTKAMAARHRENRRAAQAEGRARACARDPFYVAGCMLYWAEGCKDRNSIRFTNSDPRMMVFFLRFLRTYFDVADDRVRVHCNLFSDSKEERRRIEQAWLRFLGLPAACLGASTVNRYSRSSRRKRIGVLPYGTCRVTVNDTRIVQTIFGSIQELAAFEREEWLGP